MRIITFSLISFGLYASCNQTDFASSPRTTKLRAEAGNGNAQQGPSGAESQPVDVDKSKFSASFNIAQTQSETANPKDVDLIFVVDNSASMTNKMDRLKASLGLLVDTITGQIKNKVNFSFVRVSDYLATAKEQVFSYESAGSVFRLAGNHEFLNVYSGFNFNKINQFNSKANLQVRANTYDHLFLPDVTHMTSSQLQSSINNYLKVSNGVADEPLMAAAMEFINYRSFSDHPQAKRFDTGGMVHILSLSDEDNQESFSNINSAYQTDGYYFSIPYTIQDKCGADQLFEPNEAQVRYRTESSFYCRKPGVVTDAEIRKPSNKDRIETYKCSAAAVAAPWISSYQENATYCQVIPQWSCKRPVDGVEQTYIVDASSTYKSSYTSCTPVTSVSELKRLSSGDVASWNSSKWASAPTQCSPVTCELAVTPLPFLGSKDANEKVTSISEGSCAAGYDKVDLGALFHGRATINFALTTTRYEFCSKLAPLAVRSAAPSSIAFRAITPEPTTTGQHIYYVNVETPASKAEVIAGFKSGMSAYRQDFGANNTRLTYESANATVMREPSLARDGFKNNAQGFVDFSKKVHGDKSISWHTIANLNGNPCAGDAGAGNVAQGKAYQQLSASTNGFVGNICDASFDGILKNLANIVTNSTMTSDYELQNLVEDKYQATLGQAVIVQVFNETTQKVVPSAAYSFVQGKLTLNGSAGAPGDKIRVDFEL